MAAAPQTNLYPGVSTGNPTLSDIDKLTPIFNNFDHTWWYDDFNCYATGDWTLTETQAGATEALTTGHGGQLLITNTSADNDVASIQHVAASFTFAANRKAWMAFRLKASEVTDFEILVGLAAVDTSPIASLPADGAYFYKADDAATWAFQTRGSSAALQTSSNLATQVVNTFQKLAMYYDGGVTIQLFIDGAKVGTITGASFAALFPTADLAVTIAVQAGAAAAKTMTIDYGLVAMERA